MVRPSAIKKSQQHDTTRYRAPPSRLRQSSTRRGTGPLRSRTQIPGCLARKIQRQREPGGDDASNCRAERHGDSGEITPMNQKAACPPFRFGGRALASNAIRAR